MEVAERRKILFSLGERQREFSRRVVFAEQHVGDRVSRGVAQVPRLDDGWNLVSPRQSNR